MKNQMMMGLLIAVVVGGSAFFAGMQYQKSQTSPLPQGFGAGQMMGNRTGTGMGGAGMGTGTTRTGAQGSRMMGNGAIVGEILSLDDGSLTVKSQDGSSKIILLNEKTTYNTASSAEKSDVQVGSTISAFGTTNADGSVTAVGIQLNPSLLGRTPSN